MANIGVRPSRNTQYELVIIPSQTKEQNNTIESIQTNTDTANSQKISELFLATVPTMTQADFIQAVIIVANRVRVSNVSIENTATRNRELGNVLKEIIQALVEEKCCQLLATKKIPMKEMSILKQKY